MTIHERWVNPPNSPTIVGRAVETMVWSSEASSITSINAPKIVRMGWVDGVEPASGIRSSEGLTSV